MDEGVAQLSARQKAAVLCVTLGPEGAAQIFKHLPDDVMERLTVEMARRAGGDKSAATAELPKIEGKMLPQNRN